MTRLSIRDRIREIQDDDIDQVLQRYPIRIPKYPHTKTYGSFMEDAEDAARLKVDQAGEIDDLKTKHEREVDALKVRHERESNRQKSDDESEKEREANQAKRQSESVEEAYGKKKAKGKDIAKKMMKSKTMKAFAKKVAKMRTISAKELDDLLPDYVSGGDIGALFGEEVKESYSRSLVNKAIKLIKSPKYFQGDYTGAVKAIEKLKKGLSSDGRVKAALQTANEEWEKLEEESTIIPLEIPMFGFMYDIRKDFVGWAKKAGLNPKMIGKGPKEVVHLKGTPSQIKKFISMIPTNVPEHHKKKGMHTHSEGVAVIDKKTGKTLAYYDSPKMAKNFEPNQKYVKMSDKEFMDKHHPRKGGFFGRTGRIPNAKKKAMKKPIWNEGVDGDAMIDLMQKYLMTKNKGEKKNLLKQINRYQKKLGLKVTEAAGFKQPFGKITQADKDDAVDFLQAIKKGDPKSYKRLIKRLKLKEVLGANATVGDYISDFSKSDAPQFKGKSAKKVTAMAIAAFNANK